MQHEMLEGSAPPPAVPIAPMGGAEPLYCPGGVGAEPRCPPPPIWGYRGCGGEGAIGAGGREEQ